MALVKCPECGRVISNQAAYCPGCGMPMEQRVNSIYQMKIPQEKYKSRMGKLLYFIVFLIWIIGIVIATSICNELAEISVLYRIRFLIPIVGIAICALLSLFPMCLAQFFDDVHGIRCTLQDMQFIRKEQFEKSERAVLLENRRYNEQSGNDFHSDVNRSQYAGHYQRGYSSVVRAYIPNSKKYGTHVKH